MTNGPKLSVVMAVYDQVSPNHLVEALESLCSQSWPADEVFLIKDGPLTPALDAVVDGFRARLPLDVLLLSKRSGSAQARNLGLRSANHSWVAIADADDISMVHRFRRQLTYAQAHRLDLVGTAMEEFDDSNPSLGVRRFPAGHDEIVALMKSRNSINHPSVLMRRSLALQVGGYSDLPLLEDYDLCARMVHAGARVGNMDTPLVRFRGGPASLRRRRAFSAVGAEWALQRSLHRAGIVAAWRMPVNWVARNAFRALPAGLGRRAYETLFLRSDSDRTALASRPAYDEFHDMREIRAPVAAMLARQVLATTEPHQPRPPAEIDVLDVGSGYGSTAFELATHYRTVTGIEPARALHDHAVEQLRERPQANLSFVNAAVEKMQSERAYDLVVLDNVYEHLRDQPAAMAAISRALRPGGVLYIVVPNKLWPVEAHYRLPFLSWLPLRCANAYLRISRRGTSYDDASYAPTYWGLRRQLRSDPTLEVSFVLPGDPTATVAGSPIHYRAGMKMLAHFPALWAISKALVVVAVKRAG